MVAEHDLDRAILKRAVSETIHFFGWNWRTYITLGLSVVAVCLRWALVGEAAVLTELDTVAWALAPIAAILPLVFLWKLRIAPYKELLARVPVVTKSEFQSETGKRFIEVGSYDEEPDYEPWDAVNRFTLMQAAMLAAEQKPTNPSMNDASYAWLRALKEAVTDKRLPRVSQGLMVTKDNEVTRDALRKFFEQIGQKPAFLFPEQRGRNSRI